jgi:hypothetical protein
MSVENVRAEIYEAYSESREMFPTWHISRSDVDAILNAATEDGRIDFNEYDAVKEFAGDLFSNPVGTFDPGVPTALAAFIERWFTDVG